MKKLPSQMGAIAAASMLATPAFADGVTLTIDGVRNADGSIIVLVFDDKSAYDQLNWRKAAQYADIRARAGSVTRRFPDLTAGPYAIFVFHDEDGDQDLDYDQERFLEGVGVSGATSETPEPSFAEASVMPGDVAISVYYGE